jgi:hypothetical protein
MSELPPDLTQRVAEGMDPEEAWSVHYQRDGRLEMWAAQLKNYLDVYRDGGPAHPELRHMVPYGVPDELASKLGERAGELRNLLAEIEERELYVRRKVAGMRDSAEMLTRAADRIEAGPIKRDVTTTEEER